ncbi:MAG: hypothetical protein DWI28_00190 [Planctomycetota bacterium]|nr:MAG: hypothetical protein DWI28_00190 [Planctomycetota bacterium]
MGRVGSEEIKGRVGYSIALVSPFGVDAYVPNKWGSLNVQLVNPTNEPLELLSTSYFEEEPTLQFGRRVWIPARSRMETWHPILMPNVAADVTRFNLRSLVMDAKQAREVLIRSDSGYLQLDAALRRTEATPVTGLIETLDESPSEESEAAYELLAASRLQSNLNRQIKLFSDRMLPTGEESLQALDQLVIADSRIVNDGAGLSAIRRWLFGGGRVWVMLDRVDPRVLDLLLGDEFIGETVDRTGLTTVRLESAAALGGEKWTQEYEQPVEFVRMVVSDVDVAYSIDGWPAAFWKNCGDGRLLVTTLGPQGWMRRRVASERGTPDLGKYALLAPLQNLVPAFFLPRPVPLLSEEMLEPQMREYVGYSIPSRLLVGSLLIGLSVLLAGLGFCLWRARRLELMGLIGPGLSLSVSLVLVLVGQHQRSAVPASVTSLQFVQAVSGTDDIRVQGVAGLFAPEAGAATVSGEQGGWLMPEMTGLKGTTRRMVWTDLGTWHWENLLETAGLRSATFRHSGTTSERIEARATFGPTGVVGRLYGSAGHAPADVLLATRDGRIGVDIQDDRTFVAPAENVFTSEQFLSAGFLTDEQNRRRRTLQQLLTNPQRREYPAAAQLFFWSDPWDLGFRFGERSQSFGATLVAVPVRWERPPAGTEVAISAPLLPYRATIGPDGELPPALWDAKQHTWQEKAAPSSTWLRFQVPAVLLPLRIQRARLTIQVAGPVGKLEIAAHRAPDIVTLKTWIDPVGTLAVDISDAELLNVSADGGLLLRVSGGDPDRPELTNADLQLGEKRSYWQIELLTLDLHGKTIDPSKPE